MQNTIEHQGVIISIDGKVAQVKIEQTSACASCHVKSVCGASEKSEKIIDANIIDDTLTIGDQVTIIGQKSLGLLAILLGETNILNVKFVLPFNSLNVYLYTSSSGEAFTSRFSIQVIFFSFLNFM